MPKHPNLMRGVLVLGVLTASVSSFAADLLQLYREALTFDAPYAAAKATVEAGREKLPQGRAGLLPVVGLSANTTWNQNNYQVPPTVDVARNFNANAYSLTLTQPLFRWQNWVQYDQAKLQVAQAEATFVQAGQDLILRVAQAYFDVLYAEENLKALQASKASIVLQLEQARKNFEVGTATITDTHEAQSRFDLVSAQEIAAQSDLDVKKFALRQVVGKDVNVLNHLRPDVVLKPPQPANLAPWVAAAETDNLSVQVQQAAKEIAAKEIERNRAGHYPTLDAVASVGRSVSAYSPSSGVNTLETNSNAIGVQLNIPLYQGGYVSSKTREAIANRDAAAASLESARRTATQGAQQSFLGVTNGLSQVKALEAALVSSNSALESNKLGYEVGVRINIDVLNAEQQVYTTKRDLSKARLDTLLAQLRLKAAVGALSEADLEAINPLFSPAGAR